MLAKKTVRLFLRVFSVFVVILVVVVGYTCTLSLVGAVFFPAQSTGQIVIKEGLVCGSALLGSTHQDEKYFWGNGAEYLLAVKNEGGEILQYNASTVFDTEYESIIISFGTDPHITVEQAYQQAERVSKARGIEVSTIYEIIESNSSRRILGIMGEKIINTVMANLILDSISSQ